MSVLVPPKMIRCLGRYPRLRNLAKADPDLACWNWALAGLTDPCAPITNLYTYVNGYDDPFENDANQVLALAAVGYPNLTVGLQTELTNLKQAWAPYSALPHNAAKAQQIETLSKRMASIVTRIYGLPISPVSTGLEICMHFEATLQRRAVETAPDFAERLQGVGIGFEHWWLRFKEATTVETFPNMPNIQMYQGEQAHGHRAIWRAHIAELQQEHLNKLNLIIQAIKGAPPFAHRPGPRPWQADAVAPRCTWCETQFTLFTRRHHCRSCGLVFCSQCAFRTEMVANPSVATGIAPAAVARVCDTCYTGNQ